VNNGTTLSVDVLKTFYSWNGSDTGAAPCGQATKCVLDTYERQYPYALTNDTVALMSDT